MRSLRIPNTKANQLLTLLGSGERFEVIDKLVSDTSVPAVFVLCGHVRRLTWGHIYRSAFVAVTAADDNTVDVRVSHLNVQRQWHGSNIFRWGDSKIVDELCAYIREAIPDATDSAT